MVFYDFSHLGLIGVDIFFIISGFIMGVIAVERFEDKSFKNVKKFLWRRFVRVVPLYWFYTFVKAGLLLFLPFLFVADAFDVVKLLKSLFFIPHMNLNGSTLPIHSVGWTLNFEVMFYALAAISLLLVKSWRFAFILLAFVTLVLMGTFVESASEAFAFWTRTIVFEFVLGLAVAWIYVRKKDVMENLPTTVLVPLAIVCMALFAYVGMYGLEQKAMPRFIWFGVPSLCLFVCINFGYGKTL